MLSGRHILLGLIGLCLISFILAGFTYNATSPKNLKNPPNSSSDKENWIVEVIPEGGSIFSVLEKSNVPLSEIATVSYRFGNYVDVTTIQPGDTLKLQLSPNKQRISKLMFVQEPTLRHIFTAQGDSLVYAKEQLPVQIRSRLLTGKLEGTLDSSLLALGLLPSEKQQINNGLEADINFARDAKAGDTFSIYLQERLFEGSKLPGSKILYVSYDGERTGKHELFRYEDSTDESVLSGLYTVDGKSNDTAGVGYPLTSCHVISPFGSRIDPIYGRWAHHQGFDYRAHYGTPVYAVANGTVVGACFSGGWGNEVKIRHGNGLVSQYAHLSSMSVSGGQKVVRGQVIGRVGSTGRSTGAHLHFGLLSGNNYINPNQLRMVGAEKLNDTHMTIFKNQIANIRKEVAALSRKTA